MKKRLISLCLFCLCSVALSAAQIESVYLTYQKEADFQRISEFFTDKEVPGDRLILRTTELRDGRYFKIRLDESVSAGSGEWVLDLLSSEDKEPQVIRFPLDGNEGRFNWVYLGLTDEKWQNPKLKILAWRLRLLKGDDCLAEKKSFLWEME